MARTLVQIQREMEKLQVEAERVKASEVAGVVAKIKTAIDFYGITVGDLFGAKPEAGAKGKRKYSPRKNEKLTKAPSSPKYKDPESGKTWTGHGMRPGWFVKAIEGGKKAEELAI
jgi:DNA-binding protein H-NS